MAELFRKAVYRLSILIYVVCPDDSLAAPHVIATSKFVAVKRVKQ